MTTMRVVLPGQAFILNFTPNQSSSKVIPVHKTSSELWIQTCSNLSLPNTKSGQKWTNDSENTHQITHTNHKWGKYCLNQYTLGQKLWQKVSTIVSQKSGSKIFDKLLYASLFSFDMNIFAYFTAAVCWVPDYNFDACLLRRVQNYQKRQIAWFDPATKH